MANIVLLFLLDYSNRDKHQIGRIAKHKDYAKDNISKIKLKIMMKF